MRDTISKGNLDLRIQLIAIILFICFEIYHRNSSSAVAQIRAGSSMIEEQCREWNTNNCVSRPPPSIDSELLESSTGGLAQHLFALSPTNPQLMPCVPGITLPPGDRGES